MDENEEVYSRENIKEYRYDDYAGKKRRILILLLVYSAVIGVIYSLLPEENTALDFIVGLPGLILVLSWCFTDAAERNHRIGFLMKLLLVFIFMAGLPIYLLQTRGIGALKSLGLTLLFVAAMFACMISAGLATLYVGDLVGAWELQYRWLN